MFTAYFVGRFGATGLAEPGSLDHPTSICIQPSTKDLFVADYMNNRIQVYRSDGNFVRSFGSHGSGPGLFYGPVCVRFDNAERLLVVDSHNCRIHTFSSQGEPLSVFGSEGSQEGELRCPSSLAVDPAGLIYVSDTQNHRVQVFRPDGAFVRAFGGLGAEPGRFSYPSGLAFARNGELFVADHLNARIQVFRPDGEFVRCFPSFIPDPKREKIPNLPPEESQVKPCGLAFDAQHRLFVSDREKNAVFVFSDQGEPLGAPLIEDKIRCPQDLLIDSQDVLFLVNYGNKTDRPEDQSYRHILMFFLS